MATKAAGAEVPQTDTGTFPTPLFSSIRSLFRARPAGRISASLALFFGKKTVLFSDPVKVFFYTYRMI